MELVRGKKLLKQIFQDHWTDFVKQNPNLRPSILINVEKMLLCGTEKAGFHLYRCPICGEEKKVFHTCKSRFCPSCGVSQTDRWIERYTTLFANTQYQHIVFHPPSEFRVYFGIGRAPYFNALYIAVNLTLKDWYKKKGYLPGIMNLTHTFGKDLKFTPHLHSLITCGGINQSQSGWTPCFYIPHQFLKQHFKLHFIDQIRNCWINQKLKEIPEKLRILFTKAYQKKIITSLLKVIWYVHIGRKLSNAVFTVRYIGRYTKRPAIAESRIKAYDGQTVAVSYEDKTEGKIIIHTLSAFEFISRLIRHIPDMHFRIIRYSGFYANRVRNSLLPKIFTVLGQSWEKAQKHLATLGSWWINQIRRFTKIDPLICPLCFIPLKFTSVVYPNRLHSCYLPRDKLRKINHGYYKHS